MPSGDEIPTACLVSVSFFLCGDGVLVAKHPGQGKGDADSNGCHDDVVDGVIEVEYSPPMMRLPRPRGRVSRVWMPPITLFSMVTKMGPMME